MHGKILVVSDSHGDRQTLGRIIRREEPFDALIHCGDGADDLSHINCDVGTRVIRVGGNVDRGRGCDFDRIAVEALAGKKIMVTHGDLFRVDHDLSLLEREAAGCRADLVCFGHTHMKYVRDGEPVLFNPGPANRGLYGIVTINGGMRCEHRHL